ncbi:MAG: hypothetical protein CUN56_04710 [Phototrophicales bacterium]|nr:MAG: hypothetical protein CUN56_04710 [Phototrophicales bacterium]
MPPLRELVIEGDFYTMGVQHGQAYADDIRELTAERIQLCTETAWTGRELTRQQVLDLAAECIPHNDAYAPELMQELRGIAHATKLSLEEVLITNGFTDFVDTIYNANALPVHQPAYSHTDCTTFMVSGRTTIEGHSFIGQTWDMHATATPFVILLRGKPNNAPNFLTLTVAGCIGMIGMNDAGIAVGINNLMGADGKPGVMWNLVIRKILMQTNIQDALACIIDAELAGGHNYVLMDADGNGYGIEAMSSVKRVQPLKAEQYAHANRCLYPQTSAVERDLDDSTVDDSDIRRSRALELLTRRPITPDILKSITADQSDGVYSICSMSEPPFYSETCGAAIMRPATREFWAVWGLPNKNAYEAFRL